MGDGLSATGRVMGDRVMGDGSNFPNFPGIRNGRKFAVLRLTD
jgi:hypothetical protein